VTEYKQVVLFRDYEIRDTLEHYSEVAYWPVPKPLTIWVSNTLDQNVSITVLLNIMASSIGAVKVSEATIVTAGTQSFIAVIPENVGYLPHFLVKAVCTTAPTKGKLDVYAWVPIKE